LGAEARVKNILWMSLLLAGCGVDYEVHAQDDAPEGNVEEEGGDVIELPLEEDDEEDVTEVVSGGPVAVCSVGPNPVEPPFEEATWNGSDSYDENDVELVDFDWELVSRPPGSSATMPGGSDAVRNFKPDLAGDYVGRLTVTNANGDTDSCETKLESIPVQNLWIEMFWEESPDDMDLHLLEPGGRPFTSGDCYWDNCIDGLRWGRSGTEDDPYLDLDDISGTGPENINIEEPEAGVYTVMVHDFYHFGYQSDYQSSNPVTVNIYIDGVLEWSDVRYITGEDSQTYFAEIDWSTGRVTGL